MEINSINRVKDVLNSFGLSPNKAFGQNFLLDGNILSKIADSAQLTDKSKVLEIGPGMGALTDRLCARAGKVVCIEIDSGMLPVLDYTIKDRDNVEIIGGDVLDKRVRDEAVGKLDGEFTLVANLPYYITTPIIMAFLQGDYPVDSMVLMMQKEVAERMCASPGTKSYGLLTVCMEYYAQMESLFTVSPQCFYPAPKVDSLVIRIIKRNKPSIYVKDERLFFKVVKAGFAMRRKTLLNNLIRAFDMTKEDLLSVLESCGIRHSIRGERLTIEEYGRLSDEIFSKGIEY